MTFEEAIAQQPQWVQYWLNILILGAFILPAVLLIWRQTRRVAIVTLIVSLTAGFGVTWMYNRMGYVKLLGLPHVFLWTPLVIYQIDRFRRNALPKLPKILLGCVIGTILISLAFDYTDMMRYILGERTPTALPAS